MQSFRHRPWLRRTHGIRSQRRLLSTASLAWRGQFILTPICTGALLSRPDRGVVPAAPVGACPGARRGFSRKSFVTGLADRAADFESATHRQHHGGRVRPHEFHERRYGGEPVCRNSPPTYQHLEQSRQWRPGQRCSCVASARHRPSCCWTAGASCGHGNGVVDVNVIPPRWSRASRFVSGGASAVYGSTRSPAS